MVPSGIARRRRRLISLTAAALLCIVSIAAAQRRSFYGWDETVRNASYDGRFKFARVRYTPAPGGNWAGGRPSWVHGYPIAYIIEVGWWTLNETEVSALRAYLQKGGMLIVDDFKVEGWRGLPGGGW